MGSRNSQNHEAIFILGMHRSGTSALARMCNLLGYDLGQDLMPPAEDNRSGFWENMELVTLNERIFDALGVDWSDFTPFEQDWISLPEVEQLSRELKIACASQFDDRGKWCIKDPRISRLFPLWLSICGDQDIEPKVVLQFRNPGAVAASIVRRNDSSVQDALLAWLKYNLDAIADSQNVARTFVSFETLQESWRGVAGSIAADLSIEWPVGVDAAASEMDAFFDTSMINYKNDIELDADEKIKTWCHALYEALKMAEAGRLEVAEPVFARIQSEFQDWLEILDAANRKIRNIRKQNLGLMQADAQLKVKDQIIAEREAWIEKLGSDKDSIIAERDLWVESMQAELDSLVTERDNLSLEIADKASQISVLQGDLSVLHERAAELTMVLKSWSWRITRPLRVLKRFVKNVLTPIPHKAFSFCRLVYRRLPLPHSRKLILRGLFFRVLTVLRVSGGGKVSNLIKRRSLPAGTDREIDFKFVEYRIPKVSIIIPVYNEVHYTISCLRSIYRCMPHVTFEIIVADDLSTDDTSNIIAQVPGVRYVRNFENLGFLRNCNNAATIARGEYLYFLNNDTQVLPGFLDELVRTFEENPSVGLAGSKLIFGDGMLQEAGGIIWKDASGWNVGRGQDPDAPEYNYLRDVDYCSGCSLILRKDVWEEIGGFDETFAPAYYEDTDLAFQIRQRGLRVVYQPLSAIVHFEGVSSGTDITTGVKAYQIKNQVKFKEKWGEILADHGAPKDFPRAVDRTIKRQVLIIDAVTPTPNEDAGSLRTYNMIRMLIDLGCKVTFIPEDNIAFMKEFTPDLQRIGVECLYYPYLSSVHRYLRTCSDEFDVVFLERGPVASKYISTIKQVAPDVPIFFDTHDLHYLRIGRQAEVENNNTLLQESDSMRKIEYNTMSLSDCTVVVSQFEQQVVEDESPATRTEVLPLFIEPDPLDAPFEGRSGMLFIGGFRHQPNGDAVHHFVKDIWPLVKREIPEATFHIIGAEVPADIAALAADDIFIEGFVSDLRPLFSKCRLSVAPLRFGAGVKGKIGTALAYGLPSVVSPTAQEGSGLVDGEHVLVGADPESFARHVVALYEEHALWQKISENGVKFIEDNYSLAVNQRRIETLLNEFAPVVSSKDTAEDARSLPETAIIRGAELQSDQA